MQRSEAQDFFDSYRDAFNRLDGEAVAQLWHSASGIADAQGPGGTGRLTWWPDDAPMRANHVALCDAYRRADYGRADFTIEQHLPLGQAHAFVLLHWTLLRRDGSALQTFHTGYQLMRTAHGWRVLLAVAFEENLSEMTPHAAQ